MHKDISRVKLPGLILTLALAAIFLVGCSSPAAPVEEAAPVAESQATEPPTPPPTEPPTAVPTPTLEPTPVPEPEAPGVAIDSPEYMLVLATWEGSPHGNTYGEGKGPNTYCSRCHSPQNWDPTTSVDLPPNCVTCKFPTDESMRMATTMEFVSEEDWVGIACETCHKTEDGRVLAEASWLNPLTLEHEAIGIPNELCTKCHADTKGVSASGGRGVEHAITLGGSAHLNWAGALPQDHRPAYCSDCHDPHSLLPKQCIDCHEDVLGMETHIKGQAEAHANVSCLACHDASGMEVAPVTVEGEEAEWVTVLTSTSRSGETTVAYQKSHSIAWLVDCSRCHFEGNPWELSVLTPEGEPVEETSN